MVLELVELVSVDASVSLVCLASIGGTVEENASNEVRCDDR